ncbi:MAG: hypothetical protein ACTSRL_14465, partial [Candidatus Helarchaeota archaeon]
GRSPDTELRVPASPHRNRAGLLIGPALLDNLSKFMLSVDVCEEVPLETREKLKNYATPSQVLFNIVENAIQNHGDVEACLKYIRGLYRASRKISLLLKKKEFDLIPKVVDRYL